MKHYVIMRSGEDGGILRIDRYNKDKVTAESILQKIDEWPNDPKPQLITDALIIEILNHIFKNYDDTDLQNKIENLESALDDIRKILWRF